MIGSRYKFSKWFTLDKVLVKTKSGMLKIYVKPIVDACSYFSETHTGALIIISRHSDLVDVAKTGQLLNAVISFLEPYLLYH